MKSTISTLFPLLSLFTGATSTCYFPDGSLIQDTPCNPNATHSTCCGPGYACLSNHLCALTEYVSEDIAKLSPFYVRASCTDSTWSSSECPSFCNDAPKGDNLGVGGMGVGKCDGNGSLDRYYCRNRQTADLSNGVICSDETYYFGFNGFPMTVTVIGVDRTATPNSPQSPSSTRRPSSNDRIRRDLGLGLGLGLGLPLVVAVGVIVVLIVLMLRQRRSHLRGLDAGRVRDDDASRALNMPWPAQHSSPDIYDHNFVPEIHEIPLSPMRQTHELPEKKDTQELSAQEKLVNGAKE